MQRDNITTISSNSSPISSTAINIGFFFNHLLFIFMAILQSILFSAKKWQWKEDSLSLKKSIKILNTLHCNIGDGLDNRNLWRPSLNLHFMRTCSTSFFLRSLHWHFLNLTTCMKCFHITRNCQIVWTTVHLQEKNGFIIDFRKLIQLYNYSNWNRCH